jgi:CBS domain-containing membrane protein
MKPAFKTWAFYFGGDQPKVPWFERLRSALGALIGLALVLALAKYLGDLNGINEWLITSLGASALIVFALPQSPMAQPWAVIAGNTLSALVGITLNHWIGDPLIAMPMAAALSILGMFCLRCLHPPAAAVALLVVSGHVLHYRFAFFPVLVDAALLVMAGAIYSNLTGKAYPNKPQ